MEDDEFEWDDGNAAKHFEKHGVSLEAAKEAFRDAFAVEYEDRGERHPEVRYI